MQVYCCVVFSVHLKFLQFSWSFSEISERIFSLVCTVYTNGSFLCNFDTLWLNLLSYSPNGDPNILLYFEAGAIFGWQSLIDEC